MANFNLGGNQNSQSPSMYDIGMQGGPGGAISQALQQTIDRYHQVLQASTENQYRLGQIKEKYGQLGQNRLDYESAKSADAAKAKASIPSQFQNYDYSHPILVDNGSGKKIPIYPKFDPNGGFAGVQPVQGTTSLMDMINSQSGGAQAGPSSDLSSTLAELHQKMNLYTASQGNEGQGGQPLP